MSEAKQSSVFFRGGKGSVGTLVSGKGVNVTDVNGETYIDAMGGVAVQVVGHGNEDVAAAITESLKNYVYAYSQNFTTPHQDALVERLASRLCFPAGSKFYFGSGGSDANEMAIKFARQYHLTRGRHSKSKVIRREHSYHGNTVGTLSLSDRPSWRQGFDPYLFTSPVAPGWRTARDLQRVNGNEDELTRQALESLERLIWSEGPDSISAIIMEPVSGSSIAGAELPEGYLRGVREVCNAHDILIISDEVFVGYGRVGARRAMADLGVEPDISTLGKGLGSGYAPLSATVISPDVHAALGGDSARHGQGYTFSGLPLACATGVAVSDFIDAHNLFERVPELGTHMKSQLEDSLLDLPIVGEVRGRGLLAGIELVENKADLRPFPEHKRIADRVANAARKRGVLVSPGSPQTANFMGGDQIHLAPPYVISESELNHVVRVVTESIEEVTYEVV